MTTPTGTTARLIRQDQVVAYDDWDKLPLKLQGMGTRVVIIGPDGWLFELAGPHAGKQGVRLAKSMQGEHQWPFEILVTEGAYQMGLTIERTNYKAREVNAGITIGGHVPHLSEFQYRWASDRFWGQLDQDKPSWMGVFTRFSGWRWTQVRLKHTVDTAQSLDEMAFGNNTSTWDITLVAPKPFYARRMKYETWDFARTASNPPEAEEDNDPTTGTIALANCGDLMAWPKGIIVGAGEITVQDGMSGNSVTFNLYDTDGGWCYLDTDPEEVTLVSPKDPVDNVFYDRIRAAKLLDAFLHNLAERGERIDLRLEERFHSPVPPMTVAHLRVKHSNPNGKITLFMPQHYKRSR